MNQIPNIEDLYTKIDDYYRNNFDESQSRKKMFITELLHHQLQKAREESVDELLTDIDFSYLLKEQERGEFGHVTSELERLAFKYRI